MKRVMIIGGPGSGKSTLARRLGVATGLPVHHVDQTIWKPGWQMRDKADSIARMSLIAEGDAWIIEGYLKDSWDHRAARADTLIWLDLPLGLRMWRVIKRLAANFGRVRPDMSEGCPERLSGEFVGFLFWIWKIRHSDRREMAAFVNPLKDVKIHHLTTRRAVRELEQQVMQ